MTVREQIVSWLESKLAEIRTASGYVTDAGARVYAWRSTPLPDRDDVYPALVVKDRRGEVDTSVYGTWTHTLPVWIEGLSSKVASDPAAETSADLTAEELRAIAGDVLAALGTDPSFGGLVKEVDVVAVDLAVLKDRRTVGAVQIELSVAYETAAWQC